MKKRAFLGIVSIAPTLGTSLGAFLLYALNHPVAPLLAMGPHGVVSDRDAKRDLQRVS